MLGYSRFVGRSGSVDTSGWDSVGIRLLVMDDWDDWDVPENWDKCPLDKYLELNGFDSETTRYIKQNLDPVLRMHMILDS